MRPRTKQARGPRPQRGQPPDAISLSRGELSVLPGKARLPRDATLRFSLDNPALTCYIVCMERVARKGQGVTSKDTVRCCVCGRPMSLTRTIDVCVFCDSEAWIRVLDEAA